MTQSIFLTLFCGDETVAATNGQVSVSLEYLHSLSTGVACQFEEYGLTDVITGFIQLSYNKCISLFSMYFNSTHFYPGLIHDFSQYQSIVKCPLDSLQLVIQQSLLGMC